MDARIAELLVEHGDGYLDLLPNYSGRGMMRQTTTAVTGDYLHLVMSAVNASYRLGQLDDENDYMKLEDVMKRLKQDKLGLQTVFY